MKKTYLFIIIAVIVVAIGWLAVSRTGQSPSTSSTGDTATPNKQEAQLEKAPNFSLQDYNGKTVNLSDFAGKPLVINSWAAWCPFCKKELPDFAAAQKEFDDKVVIIAIDRSESLAVAKGYTDQQSITDNLIFLLDPSDSFYRSIGGFSMPESIFVDKNGNIVDHKRGPMDINEMRERINKLLAS
ncbi:MAG: TlpA family protein disulfide reductase [Parcubacteria group bacterium]|nr:TlpA family protein disulfide reductase [Parcubacteria group bacterium]